MNAQVQTLPLNKLVFSMLNVRDGIPSEENVSGLADSIRSHGLIENLVVTPEAKKMGVVAGRRRLAAMQLLLKKKAIKADHPVSCLVVEKSRAIELSIAENSNREDLSVVEEFQAFKKLADSGKSVDDIADSFGVSSVVVQRRLKLASVAPQFIEMLRSGEIERVDVLMALALTDDHERQLNVWSQLRPYERSAHRIRALLTPESIDFPRDPVAKFVGLKAYEKAGGAVFRDLFSDDENEVKLLDVALVHRLAQEKLDAKAAQLKKEGFAWAEGRIEFSYADRQKYGTTVMTQATPSEEQKERMEQIRVRIAELDVKIDACGHGDEGEADEFYDERGELEEEIREIEEELQIPDPAFVHLVGAVVSLGHNGRIEVTKGLIRPEDKKTVKQAEAAAGRSSANDDDISCETSNERTQYSERINRALTAHLTQALRVKVAESPKVAMAMYVLHAMPSVLGAVPIEHAMPLEISSTRMSMRDHCLDIATSKATQANEARIEQWLSKLPQSNLLGWLIELPDAELSSLFALCVAQAINAVESRCKPDEGVRQVMQAVDLNMADWWRPNADNYLGGVRKEQILSDVADATSAEVSEGLKNCKKSELIAKAEALLRETRWIPAILSV